MNNSLVYQKVTDKILAALERGVVGWHKPWSTKFYDDSNMHRNMVTKSIYRGINQFLCQMTCMEEGYESPLWLSKKQIIAKGGRWSGPGTLITFWKPIKIKTDEVDEKGQPIFKRIQLLKYYYVWNLDQCTGIKVPEPDPEPEFDAITIAQGIVDCMPDAPSIGHRGQRAFYAPAIDAVTLPKPAHFDSPEAYYSTAYHELAHSTGHEKRLGRVKEWTSFGSDPYATEELVAEFTAAMLCGTVGISVQHEASAQYIANWSDRFKADPKLLIQAAGQAQKAADFILGVTWDNGEKKEAEVVAA